MSASLNASRRSIAGKTAQYPSQYLHALQITIRRSPSAIRSSSGGTGRLLSCDAAEDRSNCHAESGEIAFADDIARHDFTCREDIRRRPEPLNLSPLVDAHTEICECDSGAQWISIERWFVDRLRPVRFDWRESFGAAVVKDFVIESSRPNRVVELTDGCFKSLRRQFEF